MHCIIRLDSGQGFAIKLFRLACLLPMVYRQFDTCSVELVFPSYSEKNLWGTMFDVFDSPEEGYIVHETDLDTDCFCSSFLCYILQHAKIKYLKQALSGQANYEQYNSYYFRGTDRERNENKRQEIEKRLVERISKEKHCFFFTDDLEMWNRISRLKQVLPLSRCRSNHLALHKSKERNYTDTCSEMLVDLLMMLLSNKVYLANCQEGAVSKILHSLMPEQVLLIEK